MPVLAEQIAAQALRDWLLWKLPAKVTAVNAARAAALRAPFAGPYVIPASPNNKLAIGVTANDETVVQATLTAGSRTAAQLATDINATGGLAGVASADDDGRLLLTSPSAPTTTAPSIIRVRGSGANDVNTVLGWDKGGEKVMVSALIAPAARGILDGWPSVPDFGPGSTVGSPISVVIDDSDLVPVKPDVRRDENTVTFSLTILRAEGLSQVHRNREPIRSAVRCVREVLYQDAGRTLGRARSGDIMLVTERRCRIAAKPFSFGNPKSPNPLFDVAVMVVDVRVFERPAAT